MLHVILDHKIAVKLLSHVHYGKCCIFVDRLYC